MRRFKTNQDISRQIKTLCVVDKSKHIKTNQDKALSNTSRQIKTYQDESRQSIIRHVKTNQDKSRRIKTEHYETRQDKSRQIKTSGACHRQIKTYQAKSRHKTSVKNCQYIIQEDESTYCVRVTAIPRMTFDFKFDSSAAPLAFMNALG